MSVTNKPLPGFLRLRSILRTGSTISETILCRPIHKIAWNYRHSRFDYC